MIGPRQKALLHIYKAAAAMSDPTYRAALRSAAGVSSAADRRLTQAGFEKAMASLETTLFSRVSAGEVPNPIGANRWITAEYYWRRRLPPTGLISSRQRAKLLRLWQQLKEFLPDADCTRDYLDRIIAQSTRRIIPGIDHLTIAQAGHVIDALTDRLSYAIRGEHVSLSRAALSERAPARRETPQPEAVPHDQALPF